MDCAQIGEYLHGYLDRELDPVTADTVEQHVQSCAGCRRAYERLSVLHTAIQSHAAYYPVGDGLARRVRAKVGAPAARARPQWQWLQLGAAMAMTAVVTWIAAIQLGAPAHDELIAEQVIAGHARSVLTEHLADVASSDQHTVKPWLSSKLDFSPPVTDLTAAGFPLTGGRVDYLDSRPVAALVYRHQQHVIDLFVWPDDAKDHAGSMQTLSRHGYNVLHWRDAGMTFWAISDLQRDDLETFVKTYSQQIAGANPA
jgi:anti-sigma factor RsiW